MKVNLDREPLADKPVSIVITAYQNAGQLPALLEQARAVLAILKQKGEIILVDDGSTDGTAVEAADWKMRFPELTVLRQETHEGEGNAVRIGIGAARHPLVFTLPANCATPPSVLPRFLEHINEVDLVAGVRQGLSRWQRFRQGGSGWWLFGVTLSDVACPVRLYRRSLLGRWPIQAQGPFVHIELAAKLNFCDALMTEVEIEGAARRDSAGEPSSWSDLRRIFFRPSFTLATT
jgi:dolichol-phosphate mannosyltransferase